MQFRLMRQIGSDGTPHLYATFAAIADAYAFVEKVCEMPRLHEVGGRLESCLNRADGTFWVLTLETD